MALQSDRVSIDSGRRQRTTRSRRLVGSAAMAAVALASSGLSSASATTLSQNLAQEPASLTFFYYSGSDQNIVPQSVIASYSRSHPKVHISVMQGNNTTTFPGILASVKTTGIPSVNCGYFNATSTSQGQLDNLWLPLDPSVVTNMADFPSSDILSGNEE